MTKPPRWTTREQWDAATLALLRRDGDVCRWCGEALAGRAERHHRQRRRVGGDRLANLLLLHPACHNGGPGSVHGSPGAARERGFIVSAFGDPLVVPVLMGTVWFALDDEGGRARFTPVSQ